MNKIIIVLTLSLVLASCKGRGTGPLVKDPFSKTETNQPANHHTNAPTVKTEKINVTIEPCQGCTAISELLANKKSYSGKTVKVKGQVTRYNPGIMGKNWVHIQDGSEYEGGYDLTVTTTEPATLGETVTFEGQIALDKDFGYGYFYSVLMEGGKSLK